MSAIATFHLLHRSELDALLEAANKPAVPRSKAVAFFTARLDKPSLETFLESRARAGTPFDGSGHAFTSLDFLLEPHRATLFGGTELADESARLSTSIEGTGILYDHESAQAVLQKWSTIRLDRDEIREYLEREYGEGNTDAVDAVEAAFSKAKEWLGAVSPGTLGLLRIG